MHPDAAVGSTWCKTSLASCCALLRWAALLQVLLAAMQSQLLGDSRVANTLIPRVCNAVLAAPSSTRHVSCCFVGQGWFCGARVAESTGWLALLLLSSWALAAHLRSHTTHQLPSLAAPLWLHSCWSSGGLSTRQSCWRHGW